MLLFSTFVPDNNPSSLEKLHNEEGSNANDYVLDDEADKDVDNHTQAVDGPTVLTHVELARTVCKFMASFSTGKL